MPTRPGSEPEAQRGIRLAGPGLTRWPYPSLRFGLRPAGGLFSIPQPPFHQIGNLAGVLVALLPQLGDHSPPALARVVLVQLPLPLNPVDVHHEANDLCRHLANERLVRVE